MNRQEQNAAEWRRLGAKLMPFADVVSEDLPLARLIRLSLFQVTVGMAIVLLTGTLNRVMIVELSVPAWIVSLMIALPLVFAPLRALIGHKSDHHQSAFGWRRGPYIWFGSLAQFGGFAIMPMALLILSGYGTGLVWVGYLAAAFAFLLVGAGLHTVQTAGLALATDVTPKEDRPRVVALLYMMLLAGMAVSAIIYGLLLSNFNQIRLIQVIQGAAVVTMVLNGMALWRQELRSKDPARERASDTNFVDAWRRLVGQPRTKRLLAATGVGAAAFSMQDVLLEPYGGQILGLSVSATTLLTAVFASGSIFGFALPARWLSRQGEPHRIAGFGALIGIIGFTMVILSGAIIGGPLFFIGVSFIGVGGGFFAVCTLVATMAVSEETQNGITLGAWGAVQATSTGIAVALGGFLRDGVTYLSSHDVLGPDVLGPAAGYQSVYLVEVGLLFLALVVIGPLARHAPDPQSPRFDRLQIEAFPN